MIQLFRILSQCLVWVVVVAPWEQALRVRCGKKVSLLTAGLHLRIPFIDRMYRQPVRRRVCNVAPQTLTTSDSITITISGALGYNIVDIKKLYDSIHDAQDTIDAETLAVVAKYVATHSAAECSPSDIENHVVSQLNLDKYGLGGCEFYVLNYAIVKTYRLIQGELKSWQHSSGLNTLQEVVTVNTPIE